MANSEPLDFAAVRDCTQLTVRALIDYYAAEYPDKVFAIFPDAASEITWGDLRKTSVQLSRYLAAKGVSPGARVGMLRANGQAAFELFLGAMYGGYTIATFNPVAGESALRYVFEHSEVPIVFVDEANQALAEKIRKEQIPSLRIEIGVSREGLELPHIDDGSELVAPKADDDALLIYTSGTTGRPKGVIHSHASLLAGGANTAAAHHLTRNDRALCVLPLCHINGQVVTVMAPLLSGSSVVMPYRFRVSQFWDWIITNDCTWFSAVPTIISYLLGADDRAADPSIESLKQMRFGRSASAALPPAVHEAFVERFGIPLVETMGITETAAPILCNPLNPQGHRIGSPGRACGNDVRIAKESQAITQANTEGEIQVRGANLMMRYLKEPEKTKEAFTEDGWYRTGDLGRMDSDGYVFVTGRIKELIIKGGENIAPREIDDVLYQFPGILEAAAIGVPDSNYGEDVAACVVPSPGTVIDLDGLRAHCEQNLGRFKTPSAFHVMDELPKGPSGKIQRLKLVESLNKSSR
ncbi:MAG: AMP-binding protein [Arenicellales bacterium]